MTEYKGWDDYVNRKRTNEQLKQTKEEWKDAVNDYFAITIPTEDKPTAAHMKQIEFQISKLRNDIYTIHTRINQITDCGHGKLRKQLTPLVEGNVLGRIEALEDFRATYTIGPGRLYDELSNKVKELEGLKLSERISFLEGRSSKHDDITTRVINKVKELEQYEKYLDERMSQLTNIIDDRLESLAEWKNNHIDNHNRHGWYNLETKKIIDKQVWEDIKRFTGNVSYLRYTKDFEAQLGYLIKTIQKVDPEWEPSK